MSLEVSLAQDLHLVFNVPLRLHTVPDAAATDAFGRAITIDPKRGLMVVFPAWIEHWVHPFHGTGERVSIAANVEIAKYEMGQATYPARS